MKTFVMTICAAVGLICVECLADYGILELYKDRLTITPATDASIAKKVQSVEVMSTKANAEVVVSRQRVIDLYTNVYDVTMRTYTNIVQVSILGTNYVSNKGGKYVERAPTEYNYAREWYCSEGIVRWKQRSGDKNPYNMAYKSDKIDYDIMLHVFPNDYLHNTFVEMGEDPVTGEWIVVDQVVLDMMTEVIGYTSVTNVYTTVTTNGSWKVKAATSTNTFEIARATSVGGFISFPVTNSVYLLHGDDVITSGLESAENKTRAVLIYAK